MDTPERGPDQGARSEPQQGPLILSRARDGTVRVFNVPWVHAELKKLGLEW